MVGLQAGDLQLANFRDIDLAVAIDLDAVVNINLPPRAHDDLVARSDDIIGGHRNLVERRKRRWRRGEKPVSEQRQLTAYRALYKSLEFGRLARVGRHRHRLKLMSDRIRFEAILLTSQVAAPHLLI